MSPMLVIMFMWTIVVVMSRYIIMLAMFMVSMAIMPIMATVTNHYMKWMMTIT